jgi:hypothetical protein
MRIVRLGPSFVRAAILAWCAAWASPVLAQAASEQLPLITPSTLQVTAADLRDTAAQRPSETTRERPRIPPVAKERRRPSALLPLYGSLIALQGMDFHSTRRALDAGTGREANPAMRDVVNNSGAFLAVKAGATVGVIWASEKMWKKNRKAAVIFAAAVNAAMAAIVANNYRLGR